VNGFPPWAAFIAFCALLLYHAAHARAERNEPQEEDDEPGYMYDDVAEQIEAIYATKCKMDELEQLLTDLQTCDPEHLQKVFRCSWQTVAGRDLEHEFWVTGENRNTEFLQRLAEAELQELRTSLLYQIRNLYRCSHGNSHGND